MGHKYYFLASIIISLLFTHYNFSQGNDWSEQTITPTPPKLNCVSAGIIFSSNYGQGWIGGDSGTILYTSNGGYNWIYRNNSVVGTNNVNVIQIVYIPIFTFYPRAFCSANSSTTTYIYRTTNQGINWSVVYQQTGGRIRGIYMLDTMNGYAMGDPVGGRWTILKTSNGGLSFDSSGLYLAQTGTEISNYNAFYTASVYSNPNLILFGTNNARLYRSTNSGTNWSYITLPLQNIYAVTLGHYYNGSSQGYQTGYTAGNGALYTTNYGATWTTVTLPGTGDIHTFYYDLAPSGPNYACYSKGSLLYSSTNSSIPFTLCYTSPNGGNYTQMSLQLYGFEGSYRGGWAVKDNGTVSVYGHLFAGIKKISSEVPSKFSLYQNYPNPFNPSTKIKFDITEVRSQMTEVRLEIYDILGNKIATLVNENLNPGTYEVEWNAGNYPSGIYFYKLTAGDFSETKKLILLK